MSHSPLDVYRSYSALLFPLRKAEIGDPNSKRPLFKNWRTKIWSHAELLEYWTKGHSLGWALGPIDLVIDVDVPTKDRPNKQGPESLAKLNNLLGQSIDCVAIEVQAPSGGRHYYLTKPEGLRVTKSHTEYPGIEFLSEGCYVVIAGSPHWQGGSYRFSEFADMMGDYLRLQAPKQLIDLLQRSEAAERIESATIDASLLQKMLSHLDPKNYRDHADWLPILMASHQATGGSKAGLAVFLAWSTSDPDYAGAGDDIRHRWRTFKAGKDGGVTIRTLFSELTELGHDDVVSMVTSAIDFQTPPESESLPKSKKRVVHDLDELKLNNTIIAELATIPYLFQRSAHLVTINKDELIPLNSLAICEQASTVCVLGDMVGKDKKWKAKRIPERTGKQIHSRGVWFGIRRLKMVTSIPLFTTDGPLQTPGYDPASCVYFAKQIEVPKVIKPTREAAIAAAGLLFDLVCDFPFADPSHRSAWLAGLLAILARPAIDGSVPMTFVDGNQRGVGKGLLMDVTYNILFGCDMPKQSSMPQDEAEMAKLLLSIAMRNAPTFAFDNIPTGAKLGSPSLDSVLTNSIVSGRILGKSEVRDYPIDTTFWGTGNRVSIDKNTDIIRRLNYINLLSDSEKAESRTGFRHGGSDQLKQKVRANRASLIHAGLTILEYGRNQPPIAMTPWGSYESFSRVVRQAIMAIDESDPMESRRSLEERNDTGGDLEIVLSALELVAKEREQLSASEIVSRLDAFEFVESEQSQLTKQALDLIAPPELKSRVMACGRRLQNHYRDQVIQGRWLKSGHDRSNRSVFWYERVSEKTPF